MTQEIKSLDISTIASGALAELAEFEISQKELELTNLNDARFKENVDEETKILTLEIVPTEG